jgi:hypothetical protein
VARMPWPTPYGNKNSGTCIHVFLDRVRERLDDPSLSGNTLMAPVMVHETTHVLEQIDRHPTRPLRSNPVITRVMSAKPAQSTS